MPKPEGIAPVSQRSTFGSGLMHTVGSSILQACYVLMAAVYCILDSSVALDLMFLAESVAILMLPSFCVFFCMCHRQDMELVLNEVERIMEQKSDNAHRALVEAKVRWAGLECWPGSCFAWWHVPGSVRGLYCDIMLVCRVFQQLA